MSGGAIEDLSLRLEPGERILWQGRPNRRRFVLRGSIVMIPFTLMWLAFALFWEYTALANGAPPFFILWGSLFVVFGLYISVGRFVVARREASRTQYVVTDRRLLMRTGAFGAHRQKLLPAIHAGTGA